jgi:hypothetical protein
MTSFCIALQPWGEEGAERADCQNVPGSRARGQARGQVSHIMPACLARAGAEEAEAAEAQAQTSTGYCGGGR